MSEDCHKMDKFDKMKQIIDETPDGPIKDEMRQGYANLRAMDIMFTAIDKAFNQKPKPMGYPA